MNYREHTLYCGSVIWIRLRRSGQKKEEPLGTDPRNQFPSAIHLWEVDTLATRSGLSMRERLFYTLHATKNSQQSLHNSINNKINVFLDIV